MHVHNCFTASRTSGPDPSIKVDTTAPDVVVLAPRGRQGGGDGMFQRTNSGREASLSHRHTGAHIHSTADPVPSPSHMPPPHHHLYTPGMASHSHWPGAMFDMARTATLGCLPVQRRRVMLPSSKKTTWKYVAVGGGCIACIAVVDPCSSTCIGCAVTCTTQLPHIC